MRKPPIFWLKMAKNVLWAICYGQFLSHHWVKFDEIWLICFAFVPSHHRTNYMRS